MSHDHSSHAGKLSDRNLYAAIGVNFLLTLVQIIGGILSGSLSLIADAIHNFSDAVSLVIALVARIIGRKPRDRSHTFGYGRIELVATLVNLTTLVVIGLYLIYEAVLRIFQPVEIQGWTVVIIAAVALVIDVITALLTYRMSKTSMNIKAAFLHNVSDALGSVGVIIAGTLILLFGWHWADTAVTFMIAGYVLWQAIAMLPRTINILIDGVPPHLSLGEVKVAMDEVPHVKEVHHVHIRQLDEKSSCLESHVVIDTTSIDHAAVVKSSIKTMLKEKFDIHHSTLEIEFIEKCSKECL